MTSKLEYFRDEIRSLGFGNWLRFKWQVQRAKRAGKGELFGFHVPWRESPLHFRAGTTDLLVFHQNIIGNEYRCLDDVTDAALIIDCGANVGYAASHFLAKHQCAELIAVEPDGGNFAVLQENLQAYRDRCSLVNSGVWHREAELVISEGQMGEGGEWGVQVREAKPGESGTMEAVDVGALLRRSGHARISILKIDIEGAEEHIFHSRPDWLDQVDNLVIELHSDACERGFYAAISGLPFETSRCDELHVCKRRSVQRAADAHEWARAA